MATTASSVAEICAGARDASRVLARLDGETRAAALHAMASALEVRADEILEANARDMAAGGEAEIGGALLDRLKLTPARRPGIPFRRPGARSAPDRGGGEGLKRALKAVAAVPVICGASGNCHVFVDASADLDDAVAIAVNAKVQRPGVCNAMETLLVHADAAGEFLPRVLPELRERGVELRVDGRARSLAGSLGESLLEASEEDWATEYLAMVLAV